MKNLIPLIASALLLISCERETVTQWPSISDPYTELKINSGLEITDSNPNFESGKTVFNAEFSKKVNWELTITGESSKAKKIFTGKSKSINEENATWDGSTTIFPMFQKEACTVELTFPTESDTTLGGALTILEVKPTPDDAILLSDFETNPNWKGVYIWNLNIVDDEVGNYAPQGKSYYSVGGEQIDWDWLSALAYIPVDQSSGKSLSVQPDEVYFNALVNVAKDEEGEEYNFQELIFEFYEEDGDVYKAIFTELESDWQTISLNYASIGTTTGQNGNGIRNPDKINEVQLLFIVDPTTTSKIDLDYLIFTQNEPLKP